MEFNRNDKRLKGLSEQSIHTIQTSFEFSKKYASEENHEELLKGIITYEKCYQQEMLGREHGLTEEQIDMMTNVNFKPKQMEMIREGFENGLTNDQVSIYAKPEFD